MYKANNFVNGELFASSILEPLLRLQWRGANMSSLTKYIFDLLPLAQEAGRVAPASTDSNSFSQVLMALGLSVTMLVGFLFVIAAILVSVLAVGWRRNRNSQSPSQPFVQPSVRPREDMHPLPSDNLHPRPL